MTILPSLEITPVLRPEQTVQFVKAMEKDLIKPILIPGSEDKASIQFEPHGE